MSLVLKPEEESEMDTPMDPRALNLQSKLQICQTGLDMKKQSRVENLHVKFREVDGQVARVALGQETNHKGYKEKFVELFDLISTEHVQREIMDERRGKDLKLLENAMSKDINIEREATFEFNSAMTKEIETRFQVLQQQLAKNRRLREEIETRHAREIAEEVSRLQDKIDTERTTSEENSKKILSSFEEEVNKVDTLCAVESKVRKGTSANILKIMEEMNTKLQADLVGMAADREQTEENLLQLMEETADNVEHSLMDNVDHPDYDDDDDYV